MVTIIKQSLAAIMFFTRLPLWRWINLPKEYFTKLVVFWSFTGWITALIMMLTLWLTSMVLPLNVAIILALLSRLIITGGLHEDGFADFLDGMGGGRDRQQILSIMKDSHIGSYGVIGLVVYYLMLYSVLTSFDGRSLYFAIFAADPFAKALSSMIINLLPYTRKEEEAKNHLIYDKMTRIEILISWCFGLVPFLSLFNIQHWAAVLLPIAIFYGLIRYMRYKIQGYTGDCCGAVFIICEISFYLSLLAFVNYHKIFII